MSSLIVKASLLAREAHKQQQRKYTGEPYFNHCREVAEIVSVIRPRDEVIAAALLHDAIEDTDVTFDTIAKEVSPAVAKIVLEVTDVSRPGDGPRHVRKLKDIEHLAGGSADAHNVKLADLMSNTMNIIERDRDFARIYIPEKRATFSVLVLGHAFLRAQAHAMLLAAESHIATFSREGFKQ